MNEPIKVRPSFNPPFEAMQLTHGNVKEFCAWVAKHGQGPSSYVGPNPVNLEHIWVGRTGTDRDTRVHTGDWCVMSSHGPYAMSETSFNQHYVRVS